MPLSKLEAEIGGKTLKIQIPPPKEDLQSIFVFSAHKSGSTLLNRIIRDLSKEVDLPILDFPSAFFRAGIPIKSEETKKIVSPYLTESGYVFAGARTFWCKDFGLQFSKVKKVLLLRDPRDAIISWYFSDKRSHPIPKGNQDFSELRQKLEKGDEVNHELDYLTSRARSLSSLAEDYKQIMDDDIAIYRYEDVIFRKRAWLSDLNDYLELDLPDSTLRRIADSHDIVPAHEDENQFVRQVYPGNHVRHFSQETIDVLDGILENFLELLRYKTVERFKVHRDI